ncbi:MAG: response regulator, partial [Gammaproteobacteria bacterium]|nr:response regulator [Gammaproteobacteria bacterium]
MNVLIVDDEKLARERLLRMISALDDYTVVGQAESGEQAVNMVLEFEPDIVLLDVRMPGMGGIEAGRRISKSAEPPAIVFCTAFGEHAIDAFGVNASGYLLKPVRREALVETLSKIGQINRVQAQSFSVDGEDKKRSRTHISAKTRKGIELIPLTEIRFFQADHKYVTVRHESG